MASQGKSVNTPERYFTSKEKNANSIQQSKIDPRKSKSDPEYGEDDAWSSDSDNCNIPYSVYYEHNDIPEEYSLPPNNPETIGPQLGVTTKSKKKKDVKDLYDEDNYALPDLDGCITKGSVVLNQPKTSSESKLGNGKLWEKLGGDWNMGSKLSENKLKITGLIVCLIVVGVIVGIVAAASMGNIVPSFIM